MAPADGGDETARPGAQQRRGRVGRPAAGSVGAGQNLGIEEGNRKRKATVLSRDSNSSATIGEAFEAECEDPRRILVEIENMRAQLDEDVKELGYCEENEKLMAEIDLKNKEMQCLRKENEDLHARYKDLQIKYAKQHEEVQPKDGKKNVNAGLHKNIYAKRKQLRQLEGLYSINQLEEGKRIPDNSCDKDSNSKLVDGSSAEKSVYHKSVDEELKIARNPHFPLLEMYYDNKHRARLMVDEGQVLKPLRARTHSPMPWDERYAPYIRAAGFLPLARLVNNGLPSIDAPLLTALVDRWRPETHTFHLACGELTPTLQDVAMILGLPIDGTAVCGTIDCDGWRDTVEAWLGVRPPQPEQDEKDTKPTGVSSQWLRNNFNAMGEHEADPIVIERHARAWLWHLVGAYLFPDASGNTISWILLPILTKPWVDIAAYSWGSATLAWLYRQLCMACQRSGEYGNLGGCAYLLQIWAWERFPIGRPRRGPAEEWQHEDDESLPTVAFLWKNRINVVGNAERRYIEYTNAFDVITPKQVTWLPYERTEVTEMHLNTICTRDVEYWRQELPLIFFYVVEWHVPQRVMRQFGRLQETNVAQVSTNQNLHKIDRRKNKGTVNWVEKHQPCILLWQGRLQRTVWPTSGPMHHDSNYKNYLYWLHMNSRLKIRPSLNNQHIADLPDSGSDEEIVDDYDAMTRAGTQPERAPLENYIAMQLDWLANEAGKALRYPQGSSEELSALRSFAARMHKSCRRLTIKLNCMSAPDVASPQPMEQARSSSHTTSSGESSSRTRSRGKAPIENEELESEESSDNDEGYTQDIIGSSQLHDALEVAATQDSPPRGHTYQCRQKDVQSGNVLPNDPGRARKKRKPYTLGS